MEWGHVLVFVASFLLGGILVYFTAAPTETVFVYPTPDNVQHIEYVDKAGTCYRYNARKIKCPRTGAKPIPVQE